MTGMSEVERNVGAMVEAKLNGRPFTVDGSEVLLSASADRETVRFNDVVAVSPRVSADGDHEHLSVTAPGKMGRGLVARRTEGVEVALVWEDTDEVSPCPSVCDGDHDPMYVQVLACPWCGLTLDTTTGVVERGVTRGWNVEVTCPIPDDALPLSETPLWPFLLELGGMTIRGEITYSADGVTFRGVEYTELMPAVTV